MPLFQHPCSIFNPSKREEREQGRKIRGLRLIKRDVLSHVQILVSGLGKVATILDYE